MLHVIHEDLGFIGKRNKCSLRKLWTTIPAWGFVAIPEEHKSILRAVFSQLPPGSTNPTVPTLSISIRVTTSNGADPQPLLQSVELLN